MQSVRTVVRTLIAVFLATAAPVLAAPAVRAYAQEVQQQSFRTTSAGSGELTISVDGVSPSYATPTATITVRGTVTNHTGSPVTGVQVQLLSSSQWFTTRSAMDTYIAGHATLLPLAAEGTAVTLPGTLHSGRTAQWSASFPAASADYSQFGVYPLAAQAVSAVGTQLGISRTLLPFWPGSGAAKPLNTAWIWPLIDAPQQGMCGATLATNSLAGSLAAGGRLGTLLDVGQQWAAQDDLTWAVDPALLSDVKVMTGKYGVGGSSTCTDRQFEPPSVAAAQWLSLLTGSTSTEPMLFTPYADADVAALTRAGLEQNTRTAYRLGASVAAAILSRSPSAPIAWPAGGAANASTLTSLSRDGGAATVVLNSGELPSSDGPYDNALNVTTAGNGATMGALLADSGITSVLGAAPAGSSAGAQFDAAQDFLADTAMILAEAPFLQRSLVIAPPRHWDPSTAEASALLSMTYSAPWLHKTGLSSLAAAAGRLSTKAKAPSSAPTGALSPDYTDAIAAVDGSASLYKDLLYQPGKNDLNSIDTAVTVTTSAAWRGAGAPAGWHALGNVRDNLNKKEQRVSIITGKKILLAGSSGTTPVSVQNLLPVEVQVRVVATPSDASQLSVGKFTDLLQVPSGKTGTVRVPLHSSAITTTTMQLQLQTEDGSPLTWTSQSLSVQATRYGRALLVLIIAALGVLVLTSIARWTRRWRNDGRKNAKADGRSGGTG